MTEAEPSDFKTRIARAHLKGEGQGVREVWQAIARAGVSDDAALKWVREIASFLVEGDAGRTTPRTRLENIHAGLVVTGFAEPELDTLDDEQLLLLCAKEGLRGAAEQIWILIAKGRATQGIREQWLDHISNGVNKFLQSPENKTQSNRRGDALLKPLGLSGKKAGMVRNEVVSSLFFIMQKFEFNVYADREGRYISKVLSHLERIGAISANDRADPNLARLLRERWERPSEKSG